MARHVTVDEFVRLRWRDLRDAPVITHPATSPIIADPTFLPPHETPDGRWHLFAHSIWGVHGFTSADGVTWSRPRLAVRHAMRPFLYRDGDTYHLFYERYPAFRIVLSALPGVGWRSWIECRTSTDLVGWSAPRLVLRPSLPWHRGDLGEAVGNPCVVRVGDDWALYYSAGLVRVPDCGFNEPLHIGVATAAALDGPWRPRTTPLLSARADDPRCNLGAGAIKVLRLTDGYVGLQNGIALDRATGASRSAISVLVSEDGLAWRYAHPEPIVAPTSGWRARFVYACDARVTASGRWHLYFNARDRAPMLAGREAIGVVVGER